MRWWYLRRKFTTPSFFSLTLHNHQPNSASCPYPTQFISQYGYPITVSSFHPPIWDPVPIHFSLRFSGSPTFFSTIDSPINENSYAPTTTKPHDQSIDSDNDYENEQDCEELDENLGRECNVIDHDMVHDVEGIVGILRAPGGNKASQVKHNLDQCGVTASQPLVSEVLSRVRNDWESAFTFFLWAGKQPGYAHSLREYHSMISILGKMRKFDTAWALIDEMRGGRHGPSLVTPQTLLIMIRRYCAVHDVGRAISTFYAHKRFKFEIGMTEFQSFLSGLCRYKNVKDAEHLLFCNKDTFPLNTKSFNIVLNGWCNIIGSPREAKRIWREMSNRRILHDVVSYSSIISCYSKGSNINGVLKLFNRMKALGIIPDRKVYNAVIHALAKGRLVKEARNLMKAMEENGIAPNAVTYNSLIMPLCRARKYDEAQEVFDEMLKLGLIPTVRTYHALFRTLTTSEQAFSLLQKMDAMGCHPSHDTYIMLIRKFCRWRQLDNVFKLWTEISKNGLGPDRSSYIVLIHGLFLNGMLEEAYKYYKEMKEKHLVPEPKIEEMLQAWVLGKQETKVQVMETKGNQEDCGRSGNKTKASSRNWGRDFPPANRKLEEYRESGVFLFGSNSTVIYGCSATITIK